MSLAEQMAREGESSVMCRWPDATIKSLPHGRLELRVPGVRLPVGWSPRIVTLRIVTPPGFPGATPDRWFETEEPVFVRGELPLFSYFADRYEEGRAGTRFFWAVQEWNPNYCDIHTLVRVCIRRFCDAEHELREIHRYDNQVH